MAAPLPSGKQLNPSAMPYEAAVPERAGVTLPHEINAFQSLPAVAHGVQCSYQHVYYQYAPWYYSSTAAVACYNVFRQPMPCANFPSPYYIHCGEQALQFYDPSSLHPVGAVIDEDKAKDIADRNLRVLGCKAKRVGNRGWRRFIAPRLRLQRTSGGGGREESKWVPKKVDHEGTGAGADYGCVLPCLNGTDPEVLFEGKTSLMIRNIPNQFERHDMLKLLDEHCLTHNREAKLCSNPVRSEYDFLYLPMDFRNGANLGYGFVNFTTTVAAARFCKAFNKYRWKVPQCKKTCEVSCAVIQGKEALINHFKNSVFPCHTNSYLPVVLSPPRDGSNPSEIVPVARRLNEVPLSTKKAFGNQRRRR